jgi:hypothetical protein
MTPHNAFAIVGLAAFLWAAIGYIWVAPSTPWPWNGRLIAFGLFCVWMATFVFKG